MLFCAVQPPPQALRFSHGRGERETRVTGDEPQGTMGRVQTAGEAPSRPLSPSRLPLRAHFHQKRDVWVRGSCAVFIRISVRFCSVRPPVNSTIVPLIAYLVSA